MRMLSCGFVLGGMLLVLAALPSSRAGEFKLEPGFTLLFNGKNLDGWKTKGGEALEGKADAFKGRFTVTKGVLVIDPKVKGDVVITTAKELSKDVHIKFEFLPGAGCNNDLYFRGLKFDLKKGLKGYKEDMWNQFEIVAQGNKVEFKCNGEVEKTMNAKVNSSPLGVRAEFGPMQIRHLRIKETP